ncbi:hypothetical protein B0H17DRAFT_385332 [Mycena rosella]|uniref:Uncharacterized protein n=1 Tax=Mycena rosella TaxID=1033263 RepID=A0AAD7CQY5_MYCRO|nr:hypothetical protein B0H17DRAFT_385332 [Mycena rosella]
MSSVGDTYAGGSSSADTLSHHNLQWKHKLGFRFGKDLRAENLNKVAEQAENLVLEKHSAFQDMVAALKAADDRSTEPDPNSGKKDMREALAAVNILCTEPAERLESQAPGFVFVDECTAIPHLCPDHQVSPLLRVMKNLSKVDLWFVLVSTSSKIISILPSMDVKASQRFANQMSLPPWFFLPFDTMLQDHAPLASLGENLAVKELQFYGRPLWIAYDTEDVLSVAGTKLLNATGLVFSNHCLLEEHTFAVYGHRILSPSEVSQVVEVTAVGSHMRLAKGIHAGMLITSCPSEPILALAAAILINKTPEQRKKATQSLVALVTKYRVDRGLEGELYARLVLIMARDVATMCTSPSGFIKETPQGPVLQPVTLRSMLDALLKEGAVPMKSKEPFAKIGTDVWITYTHFMEMQVEVAVLDARWCFDMLCRGTAAQCTFGQPVIDGIIFGYRGDLGQVFDETRLFLLCYQGKARGKAAATDLGNSLTCPMVRYSDGRVVKPDHLVILIDMAATAHYQGQGQAFVKHSHRLASVPTGNGKYWLGYSDNHGVAETAGDFLEIRGLEPYGVLDGLNIDHLYRSIFAEGPLEERFGPPSRVQYDKLTTGTPRSYIL